MKKFLYLAAALSFAAATATFARYESFDPCVWLEHDLAEQTGLPRMVAQAQIQAEFFVEGVTNPSAKQCLFAWWDVRADGARAQSR